MHSLTATRAKSDPAEVMSVLLHHMPLSLAVREILRMRCLAELGEMHFPLLDVGCGDGLFWEALIKSSRAHPEQFKGLFGIDISPEELAICSMRLREKGGVFEKLDIATAGRQAGISSMDASFRTIIANCSLEHVADISGALRNIHRFLAEDGTLILFVPHPRWSRNLPGYGLAARSSHRAAGMLGGLFDGFFQHFHLYPAEVWVKLLQGSGYRDVVIKGVGSQRSNEMFFRWLPASLASFTWKSASGAYPDWYSFLKVAYVKKQREFLEEIERGGIIHDDVDRADLFELFITAKHGG